MKYIEHKKRLGKQEGSIMVTAMMIMAILSMIGLYANNVATTELQITTNIETNNTAFYDADAGVQHTLARIKQKLNSGTKINNIDLTDSEFDPPNGFSFSVTKTGNWSGSGPYGFEVTGNGPKNAASGIAVRFNTVPDNIEPFKVGILSDGDININGAPNITGKMHANGNVRQNGAGSINGSVSAHGTVTVGSAVSGDITPNAPVIEVPQITDGVTNDEYDFSFWRNLAQNSPNEYYAGSYTFNPAANADLNHKIIFAEGNITVGGNNFTNVTLVSKGEIIINGASAMNADNTIGTAVIAGGDITFNGASTCYGAFLSNSEAVWNGTGIVHGAIVSRGNITRNGVLNFVHNDNFNNPNLPKIYSVGLASWAEQGML